MTKPIVWVIFFSGLVSMSASAASYTVCFEHEATFTDNSGTGITDSGDYWTGTPTTNPFPGLRVKIENWKPSPAGYVTATGWTWADVDGCVDFEWTALSADWKISIQSRAKVTGDEVVVYDNTSPGAKKYRYLNNEVPTPGSNYVVTFDGGTAEAKDVFRSLHVIAYALSKWDMTPGYDLLEANDEHYEVYAGQGVTCNVPGNTCVSGCTACATANGMFLPRFGTQNKFIIAHELGHYQLRRLMEVTGGTPFKVSNCDVTLGLGSEICGSNTTGHDMLSLETSACAAMEGFAHFHAATVWNDTASSNSRDCAYVYSKTLSFGSTPYQIDCETGHSDFESDFAETQCSNCTEERGVELDWLRLLWDMLTNTSDNCDTVDAQDLADWFARADDWDAAVDDPLNATSYLNDAAADDADLEDCWDRHSAGRIYPVCP